MKIVNRWTGKTLWEDQADTMLKSIVAANEAGADLTGADLTGADLTGADLTGANLTDANLTDADLRGAKLPSNVPVVENLDAKILKAVADGGKLEMGAWHDETCGTTHCRAGWAITLAGDAGKALEESFGSAVAGSLIYHASTGKIPDFYATNEEAMEDIRRCAGTTSVG